MPLSQARHYDQLKIQDMNLQEQVLVMVRGTSEKYLPEPSKNDILWDAIIGIRRFSNSCRWKEFWRLKKLEEIREKSNLSPKLVDGEGFFDSEMKVAVKKEGLNSRLRAKEKMNRVMKGSEDLKAFLSAVEREIFDHIFDKGNAYKPNLKSEDLKNACNLQDAQMVAIPTDKTNSFKCINI
jgi:hypothetical protein